jgi:hypothetical protein
MTRKKVSVMTTRQFAEKMEVNYRTALNWLEAGRVPGAEMKDSPVGPYWEIPETALKMERPKPGPKPQEKAKPSKKATVTKRARNN